MTSQKTNIPSLLAGERIVLQGQGSYKHNLRSGWRVAQCLLTNQRLIMCQRLAISSEIPLSDIKGMAVERIHYVLRKMACLSICYNVRDGSRESRTWFIAKDLENWTKRIISQAALLKVDLDVIEKISAKLDPDSREILWYLWESRHAKIDQLAELIDAPNHMHILLMIRETINPVAENIVGCPILSFERSKVDTETGETILFSWWLMGEQDRWMPGEDRLLDIYDEGPYIRVIMEVRGVDASDLRLEVEGDLLTVSSRKNGASLKETVHLPVKVKPDNLQMHLKNNLLETKLSKLKSPRSTVPPGRIPTSNEQ